MVERMTAAELIELQKGTGARGVRDDGAAPVRYRRDLEGPIHRAIVELLELVLPGDAIFHHSPNELDMAGPEAARQIAKAKGLGMRPGWGDLEILWRGRFYMLEVKADTSQSTAQKQVESAVIRAGGLYRVVRSVGDAEEALKTWGMM